MSKPTYRDAAGEVITREQAERMAQDCIERQGDYDDIIRAHVASLSDRELMEWCVYPDTKCFPEDALAFVRRMYSEDAVSA